MIENRPEADPLVDSTGRKELWLCPRCGHRFVTENLWHSCGRADLDSHFDGTAPGVREAFDRLVELYQLCGPIVVIAQKTRIVFMVRVRFGGCTVRRDRLVANISLSRRVEHPRWTKVEGYSSRWFAHRFEVRRPDDLDDPEIAELICESYRDLGEQRSLPRAR